MITTCILYLFLFSRIYDGSCLHVYYFLRCSVRRAPMWPWSRYCISTYIGRARHMGLLMHSNFDLPSPSPLLQHQTYIYKRVSSLWRVVGHSDAIVNGDSAVVADSGEGRRDSHTARAFSAVRTYVFNHPLFVTVKGQESGLKYHKSTYRQACLQENFTFLVVGQQFCYRLLLCLNWHSRPSSDRAETSNRR